jgi:hypothetical protein
MTTLLNGKQGQGGVRPERRMIVNLERNDGIVFRVNNKGRCSNRVQESLG